MKHASSVPFIIAFDVLYFVGFFSLLLIITTTLLSPTIQRSSTWFMFIWSWIITCFTMLILVGQQTGPPPSAAVCLFQATLVYTTPVLAATYALAFMLQAFLSIRNAFQECVVPVGRQNILIHALPLVTSGAVLIEVLALGLERPDKVTRINSGMYCHFSSPLPGQISSGITIAAMVAFIITGAWTIITLRRRRINLTGKEGTSPLSPDVFMRVLIFSFFPIIGLALSSLHYLSRDGTTANIILAALPFLASLVFGTQRDMLRVWALWTPRWGRSRY